MKKILASILSVTVLVASMPAEAAFGSRSSSSSSSSRSYSSSSSSSSKSYSSPSSSRSYSSSSPSSYRSTPSSSASSSSSSKSSGSFGSSSVGKSGGVGMQRSDVTNSVRDGSYKQTMPSNNTTVAGSNPGGSRSSGSYNSGSNYNNNNYGNGGYGGGYNNNYGGSYASPGHSTGTLVGTAVGAAVVGGLVGYMLHRDNNGNVYYTNPSNPGVAYNQNGQVMNSVPTGNYQQVGPVGNNGQVAQDQGYQSAPVVPVKSSSSGLGWFWLLIILAALVALYLFMRQKKTNLINQEPHVNHAYFKNPEEKLRDMQEQFFVDFQEKNRPSGIDFIKANTDGVMFNAVKEDIMNSDENRVIKVKSLEAELVDLQANGSSYVASVRYRAEVTDNGNSELIDQIWNFKYINDKWVLAGFTNV